MSKQNFVESSLINIHCVSCEHDVNMAHEMSIMLYEAANNMDEDLSKLSLSSIIISITAKIAKTTPGAFLLSALVDL